MNRRKFLKYVGVLGVLAGIPIVPEPEPEYEMWYPSVGCTRGYVESFYDKDINPIEYKGVTIWDEGVVNCPYIPSINVVV